MGRGKKSMRKRCQPRVNVSHRPNDWKHPHKLTSGETNKSSIKLVEFLFKINYKL